ncbi:iron complex outermembrane receptor protein [Saonia flava]|uniref:Iron complex outermembrane receptor protein n=1 Tax=Saonia flava TaxID=523696 RepID=A0A846QNN7_9FLAO|nr:TonB-dependent receptor [Saonia flava]NJB69738.1 iron complex outermembrane receptor protein [Saonia flava]
MSKLFYSLFFAMMFLPIIFCYSQNTLTGTILDTYSKEPLEQVAVYFPQLEKGVVTNEEGKYSFGDLPVGTYNLVISYLGYQTYSKPILIDTGANVLDIQLYPSAIEMEEVILSTPFHKLQSENVMKVETVKAADLKTLGSTTLAQGITSIPGVESVSTGMGIGKPVIRGLSSNRVLVYSQGVRLENQQFGDEHGLGINDAGIESIEVIKGPASLLYGSDALGGVLYINPEKFTSPKNTEGDLSMDYYTNTEGVSTNAGFKTSSDSFKFLVRGSLASHVDYNTGDDSRVTNTRFKEYDIKTGVGYQVSNFKTELRYNFNNSDLGIPEEVGEQTKERTPDMPYQEIGNHILSSKSSLFFNNSSLEATIGYTFNNRKEFEEHHEEEEEEGEVHHEEEGPALHMELSTLSYNLLYHLPKFGNWETIVGVQGMHQKNKNFGEELLIPDAVTNDMGILVTSHLHLNNSDVQFGLRYDHRSIDGDEMGLETEEGYIPELSNTYKSFNAALGYKFNLGKNLITRINLASGFRAPNLAELTSNGSHEGTNRYEVGNPDLNNEKNVQTDIGLEYKAEHIEFFINGFYNNIQDFIFIEPNGEFINEDAVFAYNQQDAKLYGGEIGFHLHPHPLDWLHVQSSYEMVIGQLDNEEYLPLIPANKLNNTLRIEFSSKNEGCFNNGYAFIALNSVFNQNNTSAFESETEGYNLLNLGLGGELTLFNQKMNVRISGNNIFDTNYISHLSRLKTDGISNIGRNINIGISVPL